MNRIVFFLAAFLLVCIPFAGCNRQPPVRPRVGLYSWKAGSVTQDSGALFQTLSDIGATEIYQHFSSKLPSEDIYSFLQAAAQREIAVYALTGSPEWGLDAQGEAMLEEIASTAKLNRDAPRGAGLAGIVLDVEPYLTDEWDEDPGSVMDTYLSAMKKAYGAASKEGLKVIACIPYYYDEKGYTERLRALVRDSCDGVAVMNYNKRDEPGQIETEVSLAEEYGKPAFQIYELQPPGQYGLTENNTYYSDGLQSVQESFSALREALPYADLHMALHEFEALREVLGHG